MTNPLRDLFSFGQSVWYDNIERRLLENGDLAAMIARGDIRGVTSNPSIFNNAIAKSGEYDSALLPLAWAGWDAEKIFWRLAVEDIQAACELFLPLYEESEGGDGYVSLEVSPYLARETEATLKQAAELWERVNRPNLMIKIPATKEGLPAIRDALTRGININVTLIFSIERYREVMDAYLSALEARLDAGENLSRVASVASFFVSRLDTKVDALLPKDSPLRGKAAVANTKLAYQTFLEVFGGERFARLKAAGARVQRPLWASTSTKNPAYPDTLYVDELIGAQTVSTIPPKTLFAFKEHGKVAETLTRGVEEARATLDALREHGVDLARITDELEAEGVQKFADAFTDLLATIERRRADSVARLAGLADFVAKRIQDWGERDAARQVWEPNPAFWTSDAAGQEEIRIRLGWLDLPVSPPEKLPPVSADSVLLIGMGGSSLAPEVFSRVFETVRGAGNFAVLDSVNPEEVAAAADAFPPSTTVYVVASKSGSTAEVLANLDYFWALSDGDGSRFLAITDPGSPLETLARERGFRDIFLANPKVGGRYSALSAFGLVPAALMGVDTARLLSRAAWMRAQCLPDVPVSRNPGMALGAVLGEAALHGRDKVTIFADPPFDSFGDWLEQLIAESSGKDGKGIVPVTGENPAPPDSYAEDRIFVYFRAGGQHDSAMDALLAAGHPVLTFDMRDPYDLGAEMYRWEMATAAACAVLGVNPFDQPDVQDAKTRAKAQIAAFRAHGALEEPSPFWTGNGLRVYADSPLEGGSASEILDAFLSQARAGVDYVAINAFLPRNESTAAALRAFREAIRRKTGCAVVSGFGPRYLHSTGQLHKGGVENGLFLILTADPARDFDIPSQGISFGTLLLGQALGDFDALSSRGRRVLRFHWDSFSQDSLEIFL